MNGPWLSILMPVYKGAAMLGETLQSVVGQSEGIECIVVDQGSDDGSAEIAASFSDRMNVRVVPAPDNKNWVQNTNLALELATAPHATLLHQDDLWRPGRAATLKRMFADHPEASLWVHGSDLVDGGGRTIGSLSPSFGSVSRLVSSEEAMAKLIVQNTIPIPSAAFRVDDLRALGGMDEGLWYTADWHLWLGLAGLRDTAWSPERLTAFRLHGGSLTISGSKDLDDFQAQLAIPLTRHIDRVGAAQQRRCKALAEASNAVNVWIASVFHSKRKPIGPVLGKMLGLGPLGWIAFFRDTQLRRRVWPRLRLMGKREETTA